jgi:hypothetical protein
MDVVTDTSEMLKMFNNNHNITNSDNTTLDISIDKKPSDLPTPKKKKANNGGGALNISRTAKKDVVLYNSSFKEMRPSEKAKVMEKLTYAQQKAMKNKLQELNPVVDLNPQTLR